jgi:uncharacterized RDD family membrane protein YckC
VSAREGVAKVLEATALLVPVGVVALLAGSTNQAGGIVVLIVLGVPGLLALLCCLFDDRRRTLHDRMAGTVCVRGRPVSPPARFSRS